MDIQHVAAIFQETVWVTLMLSAPVLIAALGVGLAISVLQAATQVQEQTLTFVPKIVVTLLVFALSFPYWMGGLVEFTRRLIQATGDLP